MGHDEQEYTKSFEWASWKKLLPFVRPFRKTILMVLILNLICAMVDIALPLFQRYAIDNFIEAGTVEGLVPFGLVYAAVIAAQALAVILFTRGSMRIEMKLGRDMKRACFVHLQELSLSFYNVTPVGYLLSRIMSDTNRIAGMIAWNLFDILWALFYVLGVFVAMFFLNPGLAAAVVLIVPILSLLTAYFQNRILHWNRRVRKMNSRITSAYNEGIMGARTSKTLVIEEQNSREFEAVTQDMRVSSVRAARLSAVYIPLVMFFSSLTTAIVLARGGALVLDKLLLIGTLSAFTSYAVGIFEPIQQIARNIADFLSLQANIERVTGLLEQQPLITDTPEVVAKYGTAFEPKRENWEPIRGDIEFRDVSFRYPDGSEDVLSHFNLKIPAGSTIAIVGETGAGKSTLVNLACRFFEPTSGQVLIDGRDYRERSQLWLHSSIGYVLQSPHLFSGTVMENIRYGRLDATDEEVIAAAKAVSADQVAMKLEKGTRATSARAATAFPPAKSSLSPLPAPYWPTRASSCSTRRRAPSTPRPSGSSRTRRSCCSKAARRSSSRTACPPSAAPTSSSWCATAPSWSRARTTSSSAKRAITATCTAASSNRKKCRPCERGGGNFRTDVVQSE